MRKAAVTYIERGDERILCVWNKRYGGWVLPGGMVEDGESVLEAMLRELREEAGVEAVEYDAHPFAVFVNRADPARESIVHVFRVESIEGEPRECEIGCPATWLTIEEYLRWSPFAAEYARVFTHARDLRSARAG